MTRVVIPNSSGLSGVVTGGIVSIAAAKLGISAVAGPIEKINDCKLFEM